MFAQRLPYQRGIPDPLPIPLIYCISNYPKTQWLKTATIFIIVYIFLGGRNLGRVWLAEFSIALGIDRDHSVVFSWGMALQGGYNHMPSTLAGMDGRLASAGIVFQCISCLLL